MINKAETAAERCSCSSSLGSRSAHKVRDVFRNRKIVKGAFRSWRGWKSRSMRVGSKQIGDFDGRELIASASIISEAVVVAEG
jgi:hypothetical protein